MDALLRSATAAPLWVLLDVKAAQRGGRASKRETVSVRNEPNAATGCTFVCVPVSELPVAETNCQQFR